MSHSNIVGSICAVALTTILPGLAHAQLPTRTWVSGVGNDADPCSRTAPCKTFAGAISKTTTGGEINVLDPGGFGALTITKSLKVISDSILAGVLVSGTNGIIVNVAATDQVVLDGLDFEGLQSNGLDGVKVIGSGKIFIRNCKIRSFSGNGVNVVGTANARVIIEKCQIVFNGGGVNVQGAGGAANAATIAHSLIDANKNFAVQANGTGNSIGLLFDLLTGSPVGIAALNGASVVSFGAHNLISGSGAPTSTQALK